jgi:RNA polymerase sigma-70 factor (ECF subfamily)
MIAFKADAANAWDAAQQAFLIAWSKWGDIHTNRRGWLRKVAARELFRILDRESRSEGAIPDSADPTPTPEQLAVIAEDTAEVRRLVHGLPAAQRVAVACRLDGIAYAEIADMTDTSEAALRQNYSRGIARIRELRLQGGER